MEPVLQVALDEINLHRAMGYAAEAVNGGADWLEVGTPLIKSEGMAAVREVRKAFPKHEIIADMKVMDVGGFETEMAAKAGATIVAVLGVSDDGTVQEAVRVGRKYGCRIMVDLLGTEDKIGRAKELENMGVDFICLHVSIDSQMLGGTPMEEVGRIVDAVNIPVACAGGINSETAGKVVEAGASIIIVGGAITKAPDAKEAAVAIKKAMVEKSVVKSELYKKYGAGDLRKAFMCVSVPNVCDAQHKKGAMVGIRPVKPFLKMAGPAYTVRTVDGDWAKPVEAIDEAPSGSVLVVDAGGGHIAMWGELATLSAKNRGLAGVVIDGAARDVDDIMKMDFPLFCRHIAPNAGEPKGFGENRAEIVCGSQTVREGDWIVGDDSGVAVIPKERAQEVANRAVDVKERENRIREEIKRGSTLNEVVDLYKWEKL